MNFPVEKIHLRDYLMVILKRRWMVASFLVIVVATVTINSFMMKPIFSATTQVLIERENPNVVNIEEVLGVDTSDQDYYQTQYEILKSESLALKVIKALNLKESSEFAAQEKGFSLWAVLSSVLGWIKAVASSGARLEGQSYNPDKEDSHLIEAYLKRLIVAPIRNSRLVDVRFEGKNPGLITQISNAHAQFYIESNLEGNFSASEDAVKWLKQRIKGVKGKMEEAEEILQGYRKKAGLVSIDFEERHNIIIQSLNDLNAALTRAKTEKWEKENLFHELKRLSEKPEMIEAMPAVVSNLLIQQLKVRYAELIGEYDKLSQEYGPEHLTMVRISSEIRGLKKKIASEVKKIAQSIETEYRVALAKEKSLLKAVEDQKKEASELNQKRVRFNALKRETDINRSLYESLLTRIKETSITEGLETTNIRVVDPARIPLRPVKPRKALNILLALIVGLILGVGLAFFFEYLDNTVKTPEEVERYLKVPLLGVVGRFNQDGAGTAEKNLIAHLEPKASISEGFRTIRTNLLFSSPDNQKKVLLVTSALPLEGKSVLAANLAVTFAQMGKRVLLIDADLRKPKVHSIFNLKRYLGLSEFLVGKETSIKSFEIPGLKVITSGPVPPNPAELLGSNKMKGLIEKAKDKFDIVILDSPPLLSVTDAAELATFADGTVVVVKAGITPRRAIQSGIQLLSEVEAKLLGCVLNDVDFEKESYYYSYYRYYYKYYGEDEKKRL